ncbi:hypothetical protein [Clostridium tarantellae]|uniref:Uncharacterized protein n=1 Tax=Clostridium tarantellae TaxID=39493 RepID=A0A6I1MWS3_9CLOT|nr:hypothetical protein [Clostridium tarantellae]MPQ45241.1 hypothetical protein [Clostridium tarantellae]
MECTIYLALAMIILNFLNNIVVKYVKEFKTYSDSSKNIKYLADADTYISSRINGVKVNNINCENNKIKIEFLNDNNKKQLDIIEKKNDKLYINYKNRKDYILKNIENFNIYDKGNIFYVFIKQKNSKGRIFCYEKE